MSDSSAIRAGKAFVEISTDDAQFKKALDRTARQFRAWGATLTAAGAKLLGIGSAIAAPLIAATRTFSDMGDELAKASVRTGVSVESLSKLKYAADQSGTSLEGLETGLKKMSKLVAEAGAGSQEAAVKIGLLGLNVGQLLKMNPEEQLAAFADAIANTTNPTERAAVAMEVFGKAGTMLIPLLAEGSKGLRKLYEDAERLGLVVSTRDAKAAEEFHERLNDLWSVVKATAFTIGGALAPAVRLVTVLVTEGVNRAKQFISEYREILMVAGAVAGGLVLVGGALLALGTAFSIASSVIGVVALGLGAVGTALAALYSPLGMLAVAIGAGVYALFRYTSVGKTVVEYLGQVFGTLKEDATEALGGIRDAISTGDWKTAALILWTTLKIEWTRGVNQLKVLWAELKFAVVDLLSGMASDIETVWSYLMEFLKSGWTGAKYAAGAFLDWLGNSFKATVNAVADLLQDLFLTTGKKQLAVDLRDIDAKERAGYYSKDSATNKRIADQQRAAAQNTFGSYDDKARADRDRQRQGDYQRRRQAADDAYNQAQAGITADAEAGRKKIEAEREKARKEHAAELEKKLGEATDPKEIEELKNQLHHMVEEARLKANPRFGKPAFIPDEASKAVDDAMKRSAGGTFNKSALFGFGAGSTMDKIEKNTRDTAAAVKKINFSGQASENFDFGRFG